MKTQAKVLLVDDDADFVAMNKAVLEHHGYAVCVAYNGTECLQRARQEKPDLIVLDVMMAQATEGITVTYALRSAPETEKIPILMVTAVDSKMPTLRVPEDFPLLVHAYIEKPVKPERLLEWVAKALQQASAASP